MMLAFTGHRPEKLPWGTCDSDPRCQALLLRMRLLIDQQIESGVTDFCCGMARGCDFYFAQAVIERKTADPRLRLYAYLPCESQSARWAQADRQTYQQLLSRCDEVYLLQRSYTQGCMLARNRRMVDDADRLMSVWDGSAGGTGATVRYAHRCGKPVIPLWL